MTRIDWESAPRDYAAGVSHGVLYSDSPAVVWNGLIAVDESGSDTQTVDQYFDGQRLIVVRDSGDFHASVQAFTYPDLLDDLDSYLEGQPLRRVGFTYRTQAELGDKIHIVYNAALQRVESTFGSLSNSATPTAFRWNLDAAAVDIPWSRPSSRLIIDAATSKPELVAVVEGWLYGTVDTEPRLPTPEELVELFESAAIFRVRYNGDGTYTITGPDDMVQPQADGTFHISAPTVFPFGDGRFEASSY